MAYTAYDVAKQILTVRNYRVLPMDALCELPRDVLSAILWSMAEWRDPADIEPLLEMGANPHEEHEGFTVLEQFVQGHDGYYRNGTPDNISQVEMGLKVLAKFGVTRADIKRDWILSNCEFIINKSAYLREFFGFETPVRVNFFYHAPRGVMLIPGRTFETVEEAVQTLPAMTHCDQYVAVLEFKGEVTRYLVTKRAGPLEVIPMERKPGWTKNQEMVSNIVNFVMARDDYPTLPCEDE
jgi:hypothetical protein